MSRRSRASRESSTVTPAPVELDAGESAVEGVEVAQPARTNKAMTMLSLIRPPMWSNWFGYRVLKRGTGTRAQSMSDPM
jgi:hypothetical protein